MFELSKYKIMFIVVFFNDVIINYFRYYYSEKNNIRINVFNVVDFELMIKNLIILIDIIKYLEYCISLVLEFYVLSIDNLMDIVIINLE